MENNSKKTAEKTMVGDLRNQLGYNGREPLDAVWRAEFPGEILPEDHMEVTAEQVRKLLEFLAVPKQGRSKSITIKAKALLDEMAEPARWKAAEFNKMLKSIAVNPPNEWAEVRPEYHMTGNAADLAGTTTQHTEGPIAEAIQEAAKQEAPSEPTTAKPGIFVRIWNYLCGLTPMDYAFYFAMLVADYGLVFFLKEMGFAAAVMYTLVSYQILTMAKDRHARVTAGRSLWVVWVLEIFTAFVHFALFRLRVTQSAERGELPFNQYEHPNGIWLIAAIFAALFSGAAIFAVSTMLNLTTERRDAEEFETVHNLKY